MYASRLIVGIFVGLVALGGTAIGQDEVPPVEAAPAPPMPADEAQTPVDPATYRQQVSYILGFNAGSGLREDQVEIDPQSFLAGLTDAIEGRPLKWTEEQLAAAGERFNREMQLKRQQEMVQMQQIAEKNAKAGQAFLEAHRQQPGVQVTPSGLQYKVDVQGNGPSPVATDTVRCHYRGTLIDGTEFDSSYSRGQPAEFRVNQVIPGWTEALQKMKVGDKWKLVVPADLAYGVEGRPGIEPNSVLIFDVELLDIVNR